MCGIAGLICGEQDKTPERRFLEAMGNAIAHRGPDQSGEYVAPGIGIAHRRLSIIDLTHGRQPMIGGDGRWVLTYNGEIYNFQELMTELQDIGYAFDGHSDTEVLLQAWRAWGRACLSRFIGMFAFGLWDGEARELHLVRDRLGVKPLYYGLTREGDFVFGSELKALLVHAGLERTLDPMAVEEYLALGYVPDPRSILTQVRSLPPGHTLTYRAGEGLPEPQPYWDVDLSISLQGSEDEHAQALRERIADAVRLRLVADVPLGAFLSGGVDSSTVVALMSGEMSDPVQTCAIGFDDPAFDETPYSRQVANHFGTDHDERIVQAEGHEMFARLAQVYDAPFADSSALPTLAVCELARQSVKVALSGDGGDEVFSGYRRYRWHLRESRARELVPEGLRKPVFGMLGRWYPKADWAPQVLRAKTTFQALARDTVEAYFHTMSSVPASIRQRLYSKAFASDLQGYSALEVFRTHARRAQTDDPLRIAQYLDLKTWLPGDILTKVDRASMAHALEVRVPLLDHRVVEWGLSLPTEEKIQRDEGKYLLKRAMERDLPHDIIYRRKQGFSIPLKQWFRGPLAAPFERLLERSALADSGLFSMEALAGLWREHKSGLSDHGVVLWSLLMLNGSLEHLMNVPTAGLPSASNPVRSTA
ncbi:asparagine synthetase B [Acidihalobacter aeolianus]|uniref:asparagine synthase (glutamine-hydrolyzing) n=1 Tax=Acidihalobacter aeolianus TaxID=2792603 RepID=A0A1D8K792_9GAMM|nr:XrtA/PEP-CTERM system amidotransferase [Acidihalobacter aeolianus]AOV16822.1 asparagine synthetase B [Acidihalobacter aeolianus]